MNSTLDRIAKKQREPTSFSTRYIEFLQAGLAPAVQDSVMFNIIEWQWKKGELRTDRQYSRYIEGQEISHDAFVANEAVIMANKSDAKVLAQMTEFKAENSMDMDEAGDAWFVTLLKSGQCLCR